jgi:hypothetical protein
MPSFANMLQVRVTDIIANTYYARVHVARAGGEGEVDVDARPSDAINLAVRFGAPVYIAKKIAGDMRLAAPCCVVYILFVCARPCHGVGSGLQLQRISSCCASGLVVRERWMLTRGQVTQSTPQCASVHQCTSPRGLQVRIVYLRFCVLYLHF